MFMFGRHDDAMGVRMARCALAVLLVCAAAVAAAAQPVESAADLSVDFSGDPSADFVADYRVTRKLFNYDATLASATLSFEREHDSLYRYVFVLKPVRLVALAYGDTLTETSRGRISAAAVLPERYDMALEGRKPRSGNLQFEDGRRAIVQRFKNREVRQRVPPRTFDRLSIQLALIHDLAAGKRDMKYLMADQNRLRVYRFKVVADERMQTAVGEVAVLKVELSERLRVEKSAGLDLDSAKTVDDFGGDERSTFWFAPALGYLPVRIQHVDDDLGVLRMDIERVEFPHRQQGGEGSS